MNLKTVLLKIKRRFMELWRYKIFQYAFFVHGFHFILSFILTLIFFREQNDFLVYYKVGEVFIHNINDLYNRANYLWPFRYFPISAVIFVPFYLLGFDLGFILFNLLNLFLNILICTLLYKIIIYIRNDDHEREDKRIITFICLFLMGLPNLFNYILGQINLYITFLLLLSIFLFLTRKGLKWDLISSVILGFSVIIKPIAIFIIPFLLVFQVSFKQKRFEFKALKSLVRIIGVLLPISLNLFWFLLYPALWEGFLSINFTGEEPIILNHSFSLTKIILNFFIFFNTSYNPLFIFLLILIIIGGLCFLVYVFRRVNENSIIFAYVFALLIMLLVYYDSWPHHLLTLIPFLVILIFYLPQNSEITKKYVKPSFIFLNFFDLAFMGIWFIIQYWFPFNFMSTIFLILTLYGLSKYCLTDDSNNQKS